MNVNELTLIQQLSALMAVEPTAEGREILNRAICKINAMEKENEELVTLLWTPENMNFCEGVVREAGHQVKRWGKQHDADKHPTEWVFLIGHLATKAASAAVQGNTEKALHHTISTAAVCAHWHAKLSGTDLGFQPNMAPAGEEATA